jgi:hypothetical protein
MIFTMSLDFEEYNNEIKNWGRQARQLIQREGTTEGVTHRPTSPSPSDSLARIRDSYGQQAGLVSRISFKFPRSLVYTMKGAGKGMAGNKGSRWIDKHGAAKKTNPASLGKMDTGGRKAKPFLNKALSAPAGLDQLADIAAEQLGNVVVKNILVK